MNCCTHRLSLLTDKRLHLALTVIPIDTSGPAIACSQTLPSTPSATFPSLWLRSVPLQDQSSPEQNKKLMFSDYHIDVYYHLSVWAIAFCIVLELFLKQSYLQF